jgi:hypothetical protein
VTVIWIVPGGSASETAPTRSVTEVAPLAVTDAPAMAVSSLRTVTRIVAVAVCAEADAANSRNATQTSAPVARSNLAMFASHDLGRPL